MKTASLIFCLVTLSLLSRADDLDPALAPLAATHRSELKKLTEEKEAVMKDVRAAYLSALTEANEAASSKGDLAFQAVLKEEIEATRTGVVPPFPPAELPSKLMVSRKAYLRIAERSDDELSKEVQKLNLNYALALAKLENGANQDLMDQITAEKERVLALRVGPLSNLQLELEGTKWQAANNPEKFFNFKGGKVNGTWPYSTPETDKLVIHWNANSSARFSLDRSGRILLEGGQPSKILVPRSLE